jgi:hypothetical protein
LGASPRTRAGACHASGHDAALAPFQKTTARPARGVTIIPGAPSPAKTTPGGAPRGAADAPRFFKASNLSAQSATAAASRSSSAPAQATCTPRAPSEASASATGSDGRASADAPGASASSAPSFRRLFVRTETDAREPTHGKNVSPPASGGPTSLRYTKTVHVRRSSRLWSWCTLIKAAPSSSAFFLSFSSASCSVSGASKNPSESTLAASSSSSSRAASGSSPRGARRAVRASITQSPSSFAGTPVKIAALRARSSRRGDLQTGRIRGAVVRVRGGHAVPRRGLVELPQSPGRGDERRTLLGRGEPVHDSPRAARVRRARHEPRRGPGGQA